IALAAVRFEVAPPGVIVFTPGLLKIYPVSPVAILPRRIAARIADPALLLRSAGIGGVVADLEQRAPARPIPVQNDLPCIAVAHEQMVLVEVLRPAGPGDRILVIARLARHLCSGGSRGAENNGGEQR